MVFQNTITHFGLILKYEYRYLLRTFRPTEFILFPIIIISTVAVNLSGAELFFTGMKWSFLNIIHIRIISIFLIVIPPIFTIWKDFKFRKADANSLTQVVNELVLPKLNSEINAFCDELKQKFDLEDQLRITLFIPVRERLFKWRLKMACFTSNVKDREKDLSFSLNKGALGSTTCCCESLCY